MLKFDINNPDTVAEVNAVFWRYEAALTGNDIQTLTELFWDHPAVTRYGVGENLYGPAEIHSFRMARRTGAFERKLFRTTITTYGPDYATANTEYQRDAHAKTGRETKTLIRTDHGWRIVSAHVSLLGQTI